MNCYRNIFLGSLICTFAIAGVVQAKPHNVTTSMSMEDALWVARESVIAAAGYDRFKCRDTAKKCQERLEKCEKKAKVEGKPVEKCQNKVDLRAQDTLEFAGITDDVRINVLRHHLKRSKYFGVTAVWGRRFEGEPAKPYLMSNTGLGDMKKSWTVYELAQNIKKHAGIPFLSFKDTIGIVGKCRHHVKLDKKVEDISVMNMKEIAGTKKDEFLKCLKSKTRGLPSTGITSPSNDFQPYEYAPLEDRIKAIVTSSNTYIELVRLISEDARTGFSPEITAEILVFNALYPTISRTSIRCDGDSFRIWFFCGDINRGPKISVDQLGIKFTDFSDNLLDIKTISDSGRTTYLISDLTNNTTLPADGVGKNTTIVELIERQRAKLEK